MSTGIYTKRRMIAPAGGVVKGTAYLIGAVLVIARSNAAAAAYFTAAFGGRWTLTKTSAQAWTAGQRIYWNTSTEKADSDSSTGPMIGHAALIAANPSTTGSVDLSGVPAGTAEGGGLDTTELGLLNGATAGSITASKVVSRTSASGIPQATASPAAAGTDQTDGTAITADYNAVTAADGTKGVVLPVPAAGTVITIVNTVTTAGLKVYPGGASVQINALTASTGAFTVGPGKTATFVGRSATQWYCADESAVTATTTELNYTDVTTAGVAQASKAAVLGADKDLDEVHTAALYLGAGAGTLVTATAANLNAVPTATGTGAEIDAQTKDVLSSASTKVLGGGGTPVNTITFTAKDADGNTIAAVQHVRVYVADDAAGATPATAAANGAVSWTTGGTMKEITAKLSWDIVTDANGVAVLSIDGTGGGGYAKYVVFVLPNGKVLVSDVTDATNA